MFTFCFVWTPGVSVPLHPIPNEELQFVRVECHKPADGSLPPDRLWSATTVESSICRRMKLRNSMSYMPTQIIVNPKSHTFDSDMYPALWKHLLSTIHVVSALVPFVIHGNRLIRIRAALWSELSAPTSEISKNIKIIVRQFIQNRHQCTVCDPPKWLPFSNLRQEGGVTKWNDRYTYLQIYMYPCFQNFFNNLHIESWIYI